MNPSVVFELSNITAIPGWLLLVFAPKWKFTRAFVHSGLLSALFGVGYFAIIAIFFFSAEGGFDSLENVKKLFSKDWLLLAGWIHYLAFDLFVGAWEVRDSIRYGISHLLIVPCLLLTFLFGPVGLILYLVLRSIFGKGKEKENV